MIRHYSLQIFLCLIALTASSSGAAEPLIRKTENVVIITLDGVRWQELFDGADPALLDHRLGGVAVPVVTRHRYWRDTYQARREALMPFFWSTIAKDGQVFGDPGSTCEAKSTNGWTLSYPGYSEMFVGFPDARIDSNKPIANPNPSVLHWLADKPQYKDRVAAFCSWDVFRSILDVSSNKFPVVAGWAQLKDEALTERERYVNELLDEMPKLWNDNVFDVVVAHASIEYIKKKQPRVIYISFGESDEWAHARRYDRYLDAINKNDRFIQNLWAMLQGMSQYAGKTSLVLTTDHGRGSTLVDWPDHKAPITVGADRIWMAVYGPDTPNLAIRRNVAVTQSQIASTIAALLGEDYRSAVPRAAPPLPDINWTSIPPLRR